MPSLFMVMLGGRHARANTEVHDVVMAVGGTFEEVYPQLKQAWLNARLRSVQYGEFPVLGFQHILALPTGF